MKSKVNPAAIGIFMAGAIVILFASLIIFGSGRFFRQTTDLLLTFQEPVTGLEIGAPVKLMGVTVGRVKEIGIEVETKAEHALLISVVVEIDKQNSQAAFHNSPVQFTDRQQFEWMINKFGVRGQLEILSLLSGQLYIALDMSPDQPGFRLNREKEHGYWEIPTLPSTKRQMIQSVATSLNNFAQFDFKGTSEELQKLMVELRTAITGAEVHKVSSGLLQTLGDLKELLNNPELKIVATNLNSTLVEFNRLGVRLNEIGERVNDKVDPLLAGVDEDIKKAGLMFDTAIQTLQQLQAQVEPGSALSRELVRTLDEANTTLSVLRELAAEINRNPSVLITGRKETQP